VHHTAVGGVSSARTRTVRRLLRTAIAYRPVPSTTNTKRAQQHSQSLYMYGSGGAQQVADQWPSRATWGSVRASPPPNTHTPAPLATLHPLRGGAPLCARCHVVTGVGGGGGGGNPTRGSGLCARFPLHVIHALHRSGEWRGDAPRTRTPFSSWLPSWVFGTINTHSLPFPSWVIGTINTHSVPFPSWVIGTINTRSINHAMLLVVKFFRDYKIWQIWELF
jgi:hypothetical protein